MNAQDDLVLRVCPGRRLAFVLRDENWVLVRLAEVKKGELFKVEGDPESVTWTAVSDGMWCDADGVVSSLEAQLLRLNSFIFAERYDHHRA